MTRQRVYVLYLYHSPNFHVLCALVYMFMIECRSMVATGALTYAIHGPVYVVSHHGALPTQQWRVLFSLLLRAVPGVTLFVLLPRRRLFTASIVFRPLIAGLSAIQLQVGRAVKLRIGGFPEQAIHILESAALCLRVQQPYDLRIVSSDARTETSHKTPAMCLAAGQKRKTSSEEGHIPARR